MDNTQTAVGSPSLISKAESILNRYPIILQFLKFAGIGFLTTAADFLILNLLSKTWHINLGLKLGSVNVISFSIALAHSYLWNSNWAFSQQQGITGWKNFWRSVFVGTLGVLGIGLAILGGRAAAPAVYYLIVLGILAAVEVAVWNYFSLGRPFAGANTLKATLTAFIIVSIVGAIINSGLIALITDYWRFTANPDLNKNLAKVIATVFSLMWNFVGYKVIVFKK